jgi:hypothetical protein
MAPKPQPHKVKIKNHQVTFNRVVRAHRGDPVTWVPEQPEVVEIWFDHGSPFGVDHLAGMDPGDSVSATVTVVVENRTAFPYRTSSDVDTIEAEPEIIVDPGPGPGTPKKKRKRGTKKAVGKQKASRKSARKAVKKKVARKKGGRKRAAKKR